MLTWQGQMASGGEHPDNKTHQRDRIKGSESSQEDSGEIASQVLCYITRLHGSLCELQ